MFKKKKKEEETTIPTLPSVPQVQPTLVIEKSPEKEVEPMNVTPSKWSRIVSGELIESDKGLLYQYTIISNHSLGEVGEVFDE